MWNAWNRRTHTGFGVGKLEEKRKIGKFRLRWRIILKGIINKMWVPTLDSYGLGLRSL